MGGLSTISDVQDYAGAWTAERGRCHRFVCVDDDGRPANCPEPTLTSGWRRDDQGTGTPSTPAPGTARSSWLAPGPESWPPRAGHRPTGGFSVDSRP